jgi:cytochrome P450
MLALYSKHGTIATLVNGEPHWVFVFGPEHTRYVLTNADLFHARILTIPVPADSALQHITTGLLNMNGTQHKQHRRVIQPALQRQQVEQYRNDIVAITTRTLERWRLGDQIDMAQEMQQLTMQIANRALFGLDSNVATNSLGGMIRRWLQLFASAPVNLLPINLPGTPYHRLLKLSEHLEQAIVETIRRKRGMVGDQHDVLARLIQAHELDGTVMSATELIGQANLLFVAGHETAANALTWTLFLLSQHPAVLADLVDELDGILTDDAPHTEQLEQLPLLDSVVKESLRLLPPVPYVERISTAPFKIGAYAFPKGTYVSLSHYVTHHMAEIYPEPNKFLPDRWSAIDPSPYEYLPFGAGPHSCIGAAFAIMEIKLVLSLIIPKFRFLIPPNTRIDRHLRVTLSPKHGMPMQVVVQDRRFTRSTVRGNIHEMVDLAMA